MLIDSFFIAAAAAAALGKSHGDAMSAGKRADWMVMGTIRAPRAKQSAIGI